MTNVKRDQLKIFVSIVSYRDPDTIRTINSLFQSAYQPHRIRVGVVWQCKADEDQSFMHIPTEYHNRIKQHKIDFSAARGPMYARSLCEQLHDDEELYLQIDSHMRFRPGYDHDLIDWYYRCIEQGDNKPVISGYPANFSVNDITTEQAPWTEPVNAMVAQSEFDKDGFVRISGKPIHPLPAHSQQLDSSLFLAAGFLFCSSEAILRDVPHSRSFPFSFFGEELLLSMRLFTYGYSFYLPRHAIIRHAWERTHRPTFQELLRDEHKSEELRQIQQTSKTQLLHILYNELDNSNDTFNNLFGTIRTRSEFWSERSIDPIQRTIKEPALSGGFPSTRFVRPLAQRLNDMDLMTKLQQFVNLK